MTTEGRSETFELVLFSSLEVSETSVEGRWRKEVGTPTAWKRLGRAMVGPSSLRRCTERRRSALETYTATFDVSSLP